MCLQRVEGAQRCTPHCVFGTISSTSPCLAGSGVSEEMALKTHSFDVLLLRSPLALYWRNDAEMHRGLLQNACLCAFRTPVWC